MKSRRNRRVPPTERARSPSGELDPLPRDADAAVNSRDLQRGQANNRPSPEASPQTGAWRALVDAATHPAPSQEEHDVLLCFLVDLESGGTRPRLDWSANEPIVSLVLATRARHREGGFAKASPLNGAPKGSLPTGAAGVVCQLARASESPVVSLTRQLCDELLFGLARAQRLFGVIGGDPEQLVMLRPSGAPDWELSLEAPLAEDCPDADRVELSGRLRRVHRGGEESVALTRVDAVLETGFVVVGSELGRIQAGTVPWLKQLRRAPMEVLRRELPDFLNALCALPEGPRLANVEELGYQVRAPKPQPVLRLSAPEGREKMVQGQLTFRYPHVSKDGKADVDPAEVDSKTSTFTELGDETDTATLLDEDGHLVRRDYAEETAAIEALRGIGCEVSARISTARHRPFKVRVHFDAFARACDSLLEQGFRLEVEGALYRKAKSWHTVVKSEQDWFEVRGVVKYDAHQLELPALLEAVRKRQRVVSLDDGSYGVLPERWLAELDPLAALVNPKSAQLRFHAAQALMVDGLLTGTWAPEIDPNFEQLRQRLNTFQGIQPKHEPKNFRGELRGYQRAALGWIAALAELGFGGCLADDMGLGKTVVVLAWLVHRQSSVKQNGRELREGQSAPQTPSLLVVPKSLLFNWQAEAERFAPSLSVLVHHGAARQAPGSHFADYNLVLTSYGTLRRDAQALSRVHFDYVVLDEAHSIKNEYSDAHRAARCLSSRYRLALTGTPLENHLSELWSLMTFLNPGVFDQLRHLRKTFERKRPSQIAIQEPIYKSLRPFILRRTKAEAAPELPARIEKTVYVQLTPLQQRMYRQLADHYRARLLERKELRRQHGPSRFNQGQANGYEAARALEALLRLRQVACHPGLLDATGDIVLKEAAALDTAKPTSKRSPFALEEPPAPHETRDEQAPPANASAKFEILIPQLQALQEEGHKSLVFSQFTGLLGILRQELKEAGIANEYLDGQTRNRKQVIQRFQTRDDACVFLISLKTGGLGLNLTAADYVFILDPWWNPSAEAQAIDRAHRIGQTKPVIAYRLLAEGTVEAKVAELQNQKRALSEALFADPAAFSAKLTREDLEFLLT